jgi:hypothetical protein
VACACVNVEMGSYDNQVTVEIPPHMASYRAARLAAGLSGLVSIDHCIMPEIQELWAQGIHTHGSCCGHNTVEPMINVRDEDTPRMKALGYEVFPHPLAPEREDTFRPRRPLA